MNPPKNFYCSVCNKKTNKLVVKFCKKCWGKTCPLCNKKSVGRWSWTIKTDKQLKCSRCNKEGLDFLNSGEFCDECANEKTCSHSHDLELTHCTICGEEWTERNRFLCGECWKKESGEKVEEWEEDTDKSSFPPWFFFLLFILVGLIIYAIFLSGKRKSRN